MCVTPTISYIGLVETVDLVPGGRSLTVTDSNKHEYVRWVAHHRMTASFRAQIDSFLEGFHECVPAEAVSVFDAHDLELLISGMYICINMCIA